MEKYKKAGKKRSFGFRPKVRGIAKNPCDHPHGGGNGKKASPRIPSNFNNKFKKWAKTKNTRKDVIKRRLFKKI